MLDELERVRAYRNDVPEPDAATTLGARARLLEAIHDAPRDQPQPRTRPQASRRRTQRQRRLALAGGLAAAGVAVAGVLGFHTAAAPQSALARQMDQLAQVAASQAWSGIPGPGQYLYTSSEGPDSTDAYANGKACYVSYYQRRQSWIATDGSGAIAETNDHPHFTSAADGATCAAMGITDPKTQAAPWTQRFPAGGLSFPTADWKSLSTDPATLLKQVHQRDGGPNEAGEWMTNIVDFLRESDAPPVIRAALYRAAALIAGVKVLGLQTDPIGETGLGVGWYRNGLLQSQIIVDQRTGQLLAEEGYDTATGRLVSWTAYQPSKVVDSVPNYPLEETSQSSSETEAPSQSGQATSTPAAS